MTENLTDADYEKIEKSSRSAAAALLTVMTMYIAAPEDSPEEDSAAKGLADMIGQLLQHPLKARDIIGQLLGLIVTMREGSTIEEWLEGTGQTVLSLGAARMLSERARDARS